jgi:hypothetical protein
MGRDHRLRPRIAGTIAAVEREMKRCPYLFRYVNADDFDRPANAFFVSTFWWIDALIAQDASARRGPGSRTCLIAGTASVYCPKTSTREQRAVRQYPADVFAGRSVNCAIKVSKTWEDVV